MAINKLLFGQNEKGEANKGSTGQILIALLVCILIFTYCFDIYPFSGVAKNGKFLSSDGMYGLEIDGADISYAFAARAYVNTGKASYTDKPYGCELVGALQDYWPVVAEWHSSSGVWILTNGNGVQGDRITLKKESSTGTFILSRIIGVVSALLIIVLIINLLGLKLLLLIIILIAGSITFFNYRQEKSRENELTQNWNSLSEKLQKVATSDKAISELISTNFSLQSTDSILLRPCSILTEDSISVYFFMKAGTKYSSPDLQDSEEHQLGRDCPFTFNIKDFFSASGEDFINGSLGAAHTQFKKKEISIDIKQTKIASTAYWKNSEGGIDEYQLWLLVDDYLRIFGDNHKAEVDKLLAKYSCLQTDNNIKSASTDSTLSVSSQQIVDSIYSATVIAEQTFFYDSTDVNTKRNSYIIKGEEVQVKKLFGDFLYASYANNGIVTEGWFLKSDFETK